LVPSWWHVGTLAPINLLHAMGKYSKFAIARLSVRPEEK